MGDAVTLIVLVAAGAAGDPTTVAMTGATRDALGGASVEVRETRGPPDDEAALAVEASSHAEAIVELRWADARHGQATLRLHIAAGGRWIERVIRFKPSDAYAERGRTLGFEVASMLPEGAADRSPLPGGPSAASPTSQPSTPAVTPSPASSPSPADASRPPASTAAAPAVAQVPAPSPPPLVTSAPPAPTTPGPTPAPPTPATDTTHAPPSAEAPRPRETSPVLALDLMALGSVGGSAEGAGGGVAGQWFPLHSVSLRLAAGVRAGAVHAANASTLTLLGAAGVVWHPWRSAASHPVGLSLRVDYVGGQSSASNGSDTHGRPISGFDTLVDASWLVTADVDILLGAGLEDVFGETYIDLHGTRVATIPPLRAVGEAGVRLRF
ncbi:MAG: hypothetical protein ACLP1X_01790 [Polyangiaceae bacterium]